MRLSALGSRLWVLGFGIWVLADATPSAQQLLDRVVARVDGYAVTLSDVRAAIGLGIVEAAIEAVGVDAVIERQLVLAEVARFAPPEPLPDAVEREAMRLRSHAGAQLPGLMAATGLDDPRIREIARDNLRVEAYLNQRFGATVQLTEEEVLQYYRIHPDEFTRDGRLMPFAEAEPEARTRAAGERRAAMVGQWHRDLRARAEIVLTTPRK
jgi:hypothetical protein